MLQKRIYVIAVELKNKIMKIGKFKKAMNSETPINSMYSLIPKSRMKEFKKFASIFGFTEENINNILKKENHETKKSKIHD